MLDDSYKPTVYIETTIASYLTAWPSRDLLRAGHQQITKDWWRDSAEKYELFTSPAVLDECRRGDAEAAAARLTALSGILVLQESEKAVALAVEYVALLKLPGKAVADALHVGYATVFEIDYLLTWNMRHLASSLTMKRLTEYNLANGLSVPLIVTPESLEASRSDAETE
jgi:hypothetical protein